jgi:hypothetical protein
MSSPAPDKPHSAWLKQVAADFSLGAVAQVIAVVLTDCADPGTNIARVGAESLAPPAGMTTAQVHEALAVLVDRGHARRISLRGGAEAFQFVRRLVPITRRKGRSNPVLLILPFPPSRQKKLVREIVAEMLVRPQQAAETWLQAELLKFAGPVVRCEIEALEAAVRRGRGYKRNYSSLPAPWSDARSRRWRPLSGAASGVPCWCRMSPPE